MVKIAIHQEAYGDWSNASVRLVRSVRESQVLSINLQVINFLTNLPWSRIILTNLSIPTSFRGGPILSPLLLWLTIWTLKPDCHFRGLSASKRSNFGANTIEQKFATTKIAAHGLKFFFSFRFKAAANFFSSLPWLETLHRNFQENRFRFELVRNRLNETFFQGLEFNYLDFCC